MVHGHNDSIFSTMKVLNSFLLTVMIILVSSCSTTPKDGPPPFDIDVSRIPDAQPKNESLSKYGNMSTYRVSGKNYYVMKSAKNYHARGVASWYGTLFHKKRTSSGEKYDMLGMTAAHKTLPLPTYVQVTNLKNGRKVIVKVNDRGPFSGGRLIDLSYVAAKKLGMIGHGTTYVDVLAVDPKYAIQHSNLLAHNAKTRSPIYIQAGAFKNKQYAEKLKRKLLHIVSQPIEISHLDPVNKLYRVKIGPIEGVNKANDIKKKLRSVGLKPKHIQV